MLTAELLDQRKLKTGRCVQWCIECNCASHLGFAKFYLQCYLKVVILTSYSCDHDGPQQRGYQSVRGA